ncbi:sulfite exporter TauE/SafE family protein [Proteocatella sphenisci]|uniref:sulfite exporter TauE/SafE family protein n=1 Tax=Proteocatella sphenisci TaxID=181070 RepID=UPI000490A2E5|nr:TSUP family transporter [Proteocatella sphenisci]
MASLIFLIIACFVAAFIDAVAGGGGLISLPAYLIAGFPPHMALGTNKFSSSWGSLFATAKFAKDGKIDFSLIKFMVPLSFIGAVLGVKSVLLIDQSFLGPVVMLMILFVGLYTMFSKSLGRTNHYRGATKQSTAVGMLLAFLLGFYDGFFGPGTGTFIIFGLMYIFKFDFVHANGNAKALNLTSNIASLITFAISGKIKYTIGIPVAIAMIAGGQLGARAAVKNGYKLIKPVFLVMAFGAFAKLLYAYL